MGKSLYKCMNKCANRGFIAGAIGGGAGSLLGHHMQKRFGEGPLDEWTTGPTFAMWSKLEETGEHRRRRRSYNSQQQTLGAFLCGEEDEEEEDRENVNPKPVFGDKVSAVAPVTSWH